eukprot:12090378-Alexandrium_andersonii.AAC.1
MLGEAFPQLRNSPIGGGPSGLVQGLTKSPRGIATRKENKPPFVGDLADFTPRPRSQAPRPRSQAPLGLLEPT